MSEVCTVVDFEKQIRHSDLRQHGVRFGYQPVSRRGTRLRMAARLLQGALDYGTMVLLHCFRALGSCAADSKPIGKLNFRGQPTL